MSTAQPAASGVFGGSDRTIRARASAGRIADGECTGSSLAQAASNASTQADTCQDGGPARGRRTAAREESWVDGEVTAG
ncbi:MAG: hypothetical protein ACJ8G7_07430 [Rhizobacter sp.]